MQAEVMTRNIPIFVAIALMLSNCTANRPVDADGKNGKLAACPDRPNCVSSLSDDKEHFIAPLTYKGSMAEATAHLLSVLDQMKGAKIVSRTDTTIHAEFTSTVFGFVDDVDFRFDAADRRIDLRSASRVATPISASTANGSKKSAGVFRPQRPRNTRQSPTQ